jgi:dTDP-4-dehydrorhamnose 3,5-epimerase
VQVHQTEIPGVLLIEPVVHGDARGFFIETFNAERYGKAGITETFVQDNISRSKKGTLRGLHLQNPHAQGKLVSVLEGAVYDVAVDLRVGSKTFGQWYGTELSAENRRQLYVPPGFGHGFCVTSEFATFAYKCTDVYHPECEVAVAYNDPTLNIEWPISDPILSNKDASAPTLEELPEGTLPKELKCH